MDRGGLWGKDEWLSSREKCFVQKNQAKGIERMIDKECLTRYAWKCTINGGMIDKQKFDNQNIDVDRGSVDEAICWQARVDEQVVKEQAVNVGEGEVDEGVVDGYQETQLFHNRISFHAQVCKQLCSIKVKIRLQ